MNDTKTTTAIVPVWFDRTRPTLFEAIMHLPAEYGLDFALRLVDILHGNQNDKTALLTVHNSQMSVSEKILTINSVGAYRAQEMHELASLPAYNPRIISDEALKFVILLWYDDSGENLMDDFESILNSPLTPYQKLESIFVHTLLTDGIMLKSRWPLPPCHADKPFRGIFFDTPPIDFLASQMQPIVIPISSDMLKELLSKEETIELTEADFPKGAKDANRRNK